MIGRLRFGKTGCAFQSEMCCLRKQHLWYSRCSDLVKALNCQIGQRGTEVGYLGLGRVPFRDHPSRQWIFEPRHVSTPAALTFITTHPRLRSGA